MHCKCNSGPEIIRTESCDFDSETGEACECAIGFDDIHNRYCMNGHCYDSLTIDGLIMTYTKDNPGQPVVLTCPFDRSVIDPASVAAFMQRESRLDEIAARDYRLLFAAGMIPDFENQTHDHEPDSAPQSPW